jgi:hypothetical protein
MVYTIFGSPTRHPIQDKKTAFDRKKGILKITAERKEEVNGKHCLQQAVWQDGGITFVGKFLLFLPLVARRKMCESRHLAKPLGRYMLCGGQCSGIRQQEKMNNKTKDKLK